MRTLFIVAIAVVTMPGVALTEVVDVAEGEMLLLQGTWQLISAIKDGKQTPDENVRKIRVIIKDGKHSVYFGDEMIVKGISFVVDPTKNPKASTDTLPDGRRIEGIYRLEGDTLTTCVAEAGKPRPLQFESNPESGHTLRVFNRVKP